MKFVDCRGCHMITKGSTKIALDFIPVGIVESFGLTACNDASVLLTADGMLPLSTPSFMLTALVFAVLHCFFLQAAPFVLLWFGGRTNVTLVALGLALGILLVTVVFCEIGYGWRIGVVMRC